MARGAAGGPEGRPEFIIANPDGVEARVLAELGLASPEWSPDGRLIAYFSQGKNAWEIAVSTFAGGALVRRFEVGSHALNNTSLKWTPDGKALLYSRSTDGVGNIWMQPLAGGAPKQVTDFKADGIFRFDVSGDGKGLVCARGGWKHDLVRVKNLR